MAPNVGVRSKLPNADSISTYYHHAPVNPALAEAISEFVGPSRVAVIGYGSSFNGESSNSLIDLLILVNDTGNFFERRSADRSPGFGWHKGRRYHQFFNNIGIGYYNAKLDVDGQKVRIKYGLADFDRALDHARGGLPGGGPGHLYFAGRTDKPGLVPIFMPEDPRQKQQLDLAINQARIDGIWVAERYLPREFDIDQLARVHADLSYRADFRLDKRNKSKIIAGQNEEEYREMLRPILARFEEVGILARVDEDRYRKLDEPPKVRTSLWFLQGKAYFAYHNYIVNTATFGSGALGYVGAKVVKFVRS